MHTFSQKPKANPYSQSERCPGQNNLFDFSSEEPAADTQNMINTGQMSRPWLGKKQNSLFTLITLTNLYGLLWNNCLPFNIKYIKWLYTRKPFFSILQHESWWKCVNLCGAWVLIFEVRCEQSDETTGKWNDKNHYYHFTWLKRHRWVKWFSSGYLCQFNTSRLPLPAAIKKSQQQIFKSFKDKQLYMFLVECVECSAFLCLN